MIPPIGARPQPDRPALDLALGRGPRRSRHRPARSACRRSSGACSPRAASASRRPRDFLEPTLRALLPDPSRAGRHGRRRRTPGRRRAAGRNGRRVRRLRRGRRLQRGADGRRCCATLGCTVHTHVPDRMTEGYGPNAPALRDAGAARRQPDRLRRLRHRGGRRAGGAATAAPTCIVLDHHKAEGPPPPILATVNPNRLDDGSGLVAAVRRRGGVPDRGRHRARRCAGAGFFAARAEPDLLGLLDLVALATVCDVMPLTGVNRALVAQGLKRDGAAGAAGHRRAAGRRADARRA